MKGEKPDDITLFDGSDSEHSLQPLSTKGHILRYLSLDKIKVCESLV
jgi:hypothetical protein